MARKKAPRDIQKRELPKRMPPITASRAFGQKSPLIDADIPAFLSRCMSTQNWNAYSDIEKIKIFNSVPKPKKAQCTTPSDAARDIRKLDLAASTSDTGLCNAIHDNSQTIRDLSCPPLSPSELAVDHYIKRATARFSRDLRDGYYEKGWQDRAKRAHEERLHGKLDDYVKQHAEEMFEDGTGSNDTDDADAKDELALSSEDEEYSNKPQRKGNRKSRGSTIRRGC